MAIWSCENLFQPYKRQIVLQKKHGRKQLFRMTVTSYTTLTRKERTVFLILAFY